MQMFAEFVKLLQINNIINCANVFAKFTPEGGAGVEPGSGGSQLLFEGTIEFATCRSVGNYVLDHFWWNLSDFWSEIDQKQIYFDEIAIGNSNSEG